MRDNHGLIIAVDGGGSTCRVAIALADGTVVAQDTGPSANVSTSLQGGIEAVRTTLQKALATAGVAPDALGGARAWLGLAGVLKGSIAETVAAAVPAGSVMVTGDRPTTMAGALQGQDGFVAAIGTGSFLGSQRAGAQTFVGGWGLMLGDEASGAWLARDLLTRVLRWRDGLQAGSDLLQTTFAHFQSDPSLVVEFAAGAGPVDYGQLAPRVLDAADAGDPVAAEILKCGADYLQKALDTLGFQAGDPLCLMGGIGARYPRYLDADYTQNLLQPQGSALDGAIHLALSLPLPVKP